MFSVEYLFSEAPSYGNTPKRLKKIDISRESKIASLNVKWREPQMNAYIIDADKPDSFDEINLELQDVEKIYLFFRSCCLGKLNRKVCPGQVNAQLEADFKARSKGVLSAPENLMVNESPTNSVLSED